MEKGNCCRKVCISLRANAIEKRYLFNVFKLKDSISVQNPGVHFPLKISANQDLESMLTIEAFVNRTFLPLFDSFVRVRKYSEIYILLWTFDRGNNAYNTPIFTK